MNTEQFLDRLEDWIRAIVRDERNDSVEDALYATAMRDAVAEVLDGETS